jgi:8-oxo-dGTP diphosphatase
VDVVLFTRREGRLMVALVERGNEPFRGSWALPGGFVEADEDLPEAAVRELAEETGVELSPSQLTELGAYGKPGRDPRMRVVSIVFRAFVDDLAEPVGGSDAAASRLVPVEEALGELFDLAFDHRDILRDAVSRTVSSS